MRLNLGAADRHVDGFVCIDIAPPECAVCGDAKTRTINLNRLWPWDESSVQEVLAMDVCEHLGDCHSIEERFDDDCLHRYREGLSMRSTRAREVVPSGRIHFMNELHRILVPCGRATIETPNAAKGVGYFQDCTHVSPYCLSTFKYFEHGAFAHQRLSKAYGITAAFKVLSLSESQSNGENPAETVFKIKAILEAVK